MTERKNRNRGNKLEMLCPFIEHCTENNSEDKEKCNKYFECNAFYKHLKEEIEQYDIPKLESRN